MAGRVRRGTGSSGFDEALNTNVRIGDPLGIILPHGVVGSDRRRQQQQDVADMYRAVSQMYERERAAVGENYGDLIRNIMEMAGPFQGALDHVWGGASVQHNYDEMFRNPFDTPTQGVGPVRGRASRAAARTEPQPQEGVRTATYSKR